MSDRNAPVLIAVVIFLIGFALLTIHLRLSQLEREAVRVEAVP